MSNQESFFKELDEILKKLNKKYDTDISVNKLYFYDHGTYRPITKIFYKKELS